jgi:hypothetical protein
MDLSDLKDSSVKNSLKGERITAVGKKGIYAHASKGVNAQSIVERIISAFVQQGKPLTVKQIYQLLEDDQGVSVTFASVNSSVYYLKWEKLLPLKNGAYILADWRTRFKRQLKEKPKVESTRIKSEEAYAILKNMGSGGIPVSDFRKQLIHEHGFVSSTAQECIRNEDYFEITQGDNGKMFIRPLEHPNFEKDRKTKFQEHTERAVEYLNQQEGQTMLLSDAVNYMHKEYSPQTSKQVFYKVFNQEELFEKYTNPDNRTLVSLVPDTPNTVEELRGIAEGYRGDYEWKNLKPVLHTELDSIINDRNQRKGKSKINLDEILDLFYNFLLVSPKEVFKTMGNDLLLSVDKYFRGKRDPHDERLYHRAVLLSLEAFLFKMIYYVNPSSFENYEQKIREGGGNVGLSKYMSTLQRIDPNDKRRKDPKEEEIPDRDYLQHVNRAYRVRNMLAHTGIDYTSGRGWASDDINRNIKSSLVVMLYALFLYRDKLPF